MGPPKVMKNGSYSATTLPGSTALPFVISTEAQRSGEISVWMLFHGNVLRKERGDLALTLAGLALGARSARRGWPSRKGSSELACWRFFLREA